MPATSNATQPIVYVNGKRHELPPGEAETTLLQYLRGTLPPNPLLVTSMCPDWTQFNTVHFLSITHQKKLTEAFSSMQDLV